MNKLYNLIEFHCVNIILQKKINNIVNFLVVRGPQKSIWQAACLSPLVYRMQSKTCPIFELKPGQRRGLSLPIFTLFTLPL